LAALGFLGGLLTFSLSTPGYYYYLAYAGIIVCSTISIYSWRRERRSGNRSSRTGIWIVLLLLLLFVVFCLLLPAL